MNSHVWVEVSVNIGQRCLRIEIERSESIEDVVARFIASNRLSYKYQPIITNMIKEEIKKRLSAQRNEPSSRSSTTSVASSMNSNLPQAQVSQSGVRNKENGLLAEVLRIQQQTSRKRNMKLAELRQSSISKNVPGTAQKSVDQTERASFRKVETPHHKYPLESTPKMAADASRQSSAQCFTYESEQSNGHCSRQQMEEEQSSKGKSKQITQNIAQLKQLLQTNQAYNSHNKSSDEPSIWARPKDVQEPKSKKLKTQTPQHIYQKWKKLQESKRLQSQSKKSQGSKVQPKSKSPLVKREDGFFYNKGKSFLQDKNKKIQTKFKEIYPFKTSKTPANSQTGVQTSNRLFKQSKEYFTKKMAKPKHVDLDLSLKPDPIRQKVRRRDKEHDEILSQLIEEGRIKSPVTIKYKQKSPFRKTVVFN